MLHVVALALVLGAPPPSHAVAVLDLKARGVSLNLAQTLSELIAAEVRKDAGGRRVFGAEDIREMVSFTKQKMLLGCEKTSV